MSADEIKYYQARARVMTWQERVVATARFHQLMKEKEPDWVQADTMKALNMPAGMVSEYLMLFKRFKDVKEFDTIQKALQYVREHK